MIETSKNINILNKTDHIKLSGRSGISMNWKTFEPVFITSIIALVGWVLMEVTTLKVDMGKVESKMSSIESSVSSIDASVNKLNDKLFFIVERNAQRTNNNTPITEK